MLVYHHHFQMLSWNFSMRCRMNIYQILFVTDLLKKKKMDKWIHQKLNFFHRTDSTIHIQTSEQKWGHQTHQGNSVTGYFNTVFNIQKLKMLPINSGKTSDKNEEQFRIRNSGTWHRKAEQLLILRNARRSIRSNLLLHNKHYFLVDSLMAPLTWRILILVLVGRLVAW